MKEQKMIQKEMMRKMEKLKLIAKICCKYWMKCARNAIKRGRIEKIRQIKKDK